MVVTCDTNYYFTERDEQLTEQELDRLHRFLQEEGYVLDRWTAQGLWLDFMDDWASSGVRLPEVKSDALEMLRRRVLR